MCDQKPFHEPKVVLGKIYTRTGDKGKTSLVGGQRVLKNDLRIECYGTVDELNAFTGMARDSAAGMAEHHPALSRLADILLRVQHELFNLGSILATLAEDASPKQPRVTAADVERLEREIDQMNQELAPLRSFVLPGGSRLGAELHVCRAVCRRAERLAVALSRQEELGPDVLRYLNRLSDAFFVWSRWAISVTGAAETLWDPNLPASGRGG